MLQRTMLSVPEIGFLDLFCRFTKSLDVLYSHDAVIKLVNFLSLWKTGDFPCCIGVTALVMLVFCSVSVCVVIADYS